MAERKRIGVPISGLDTSTPDHSVVDGKCETLHNLRYTGEAWRNVKGFNRFNYHFIDEAEPFSSSIKWNILYKHLEYFIIYVIDSDAQDQHSTRHAMYAVSTNTSSVIPILIAEKDYGETEEGDDLNIHISNIFHFGNILHFQWDDDNEPQWYLHTKDSYALYQIDDIYFTISESAITNPPLREEIDTATGLMVDRQLYDYVVRAIDLSNYQSLLRTFDNDEAWRGSICYFLAARAEDGSILAQSPLRILSSSGGFIHTAKISNGDIINGRQSAAGLGTYNKGGRLYGGINVDNGFESNFDNMSALSQEQSLNGGTSPSTMYIKPTVSFTIYDGVGNFSSNIFDIAIYCTRIHPLFTTSSMAKALPGKESTSTLNNYVSAKTAYAPEDLPNEPFFLAAKKTIAELTTKQGNKREGKFLLDRSILENIESKGILYEPQLSEHDISSTHRKEINNSLHLFGDISTQFRKAYNREGEMAKFQIPPTYDQTIEEWENVPELKYAQVLIKAQDTLFQSPLVEMNLTKGKNQPLLFQCGSILSYPDYRAFELRFAEDTSSNDDYKLAQYQLKSAPGINYAYYIPPYGGTHTAPGADLKYPIIWPYEKADYETYNTNEHPTVFTSKGKLWASKNNNPVALPFERLYTIGSADNEILAINSAAIEMSDSKFGEFPLYVFTKEGIFAMQSGQETLYSAIIPINYDVIINPNTLAVNGAVLYFTDKGLHALTNQGAKLLSAPVHTAENRIPEWMYTTQMVYLPEWNEVLCTDLPNMKAYVYSLDSNVWSTRDIPEGYILNNDELVATDDMIYNLRNEAEEGVVPMPFTLATRPIKLGSMELKRAETMIVRFECDTEQTLDVKVEGSIDTQNWGELRKIKGVQTNKDILIRRTPCSVKYLRFTIEGNVTDDIRILAFELEYYERMRHRMR